MPWNDPDKQSYLNKRFPPLPNKPRDPLGNRVRFLLFAGVISGLEYTNHLRGIFSSEPIPDSEQAGPASAAAIVIPVNGWGYVAGLPFISSTPWAIGSITEANASQRIFNFSGFFGPSGAMSKTANAVVEWLEQNTLIPKQVAPSREFVAAPAPFPAPAPATPANGNPKEKPFTESAPEPKYRRLTPEDVRAITTLVFHYLGWAPQKEEPFVIATQRMSGKKLDDPLNSFYAEDLEVVQEAFLRGDVGTALRQYLECIPHAARVDLDKDAGHAEMIESLDPRRLPLAAWPGTHPLVTAQQFAVNTVQRDLKDAGLFSVNGPPGTGKTTMLKDIVALVIEQRADLLATLNSPLDAFTGALKIENYSGRGTPQKLVSELLGFGIVVTSANNGAVENISRELPNTTTIDPSIGIDYFGSVADSMGVKDGKSRPGTPQSWGLVSAALGKSENRNAFAQSFWWKDKSKHRDSIALPRVTLPEWVAACKSESGPSWHEAKEQYIKARKRVKNEVAKAARLVDMRSRRDSEFNELAHCSRMAEEARSRLTQTEQQLALISTAHAEDQKTLDSAKTDHALSVQFKKLCDLLWQAEQAYSAAKDSYQAYLNEKPANSEGQVQNALDRAAESITETEQRLDRHLSVKPGWLASIFSRKTLNNWHNTYLELESLLELRNCDLKKARRKKDDFFRWSDGLGTEEKAVESRKMAFQNAGAAVAAARARSPLPIGDAQVRMANCSDAFTSSLQQLNKLTQMQGEVCSELQTLEARLTHLKASLATSDAALAKADLMDNSRKAWCLDQLPRDELHKVSPYQDGGDLFKARKELFVAAMGLHKAFVVGAWEKLEPTLAAFVSLLQGQLQGHRVQDGVMYLWDAFFMVVPLVSTAFASFPRQFKGVGREKLAWLLIDESGQATPQQAAGSIWRSKRVVVVGDPIQLEPVVSIPQDLVGPLQSYCGTPEHYVPPDASAQTLADRSNRYGTMMGESNPATAVWLGSPLVVHRRCIEPMFGIANAIAYENKMVYGGSIDKSPSAPTKSCWIDVPNHGADGHWIERQGRKAISVIEELVGRDTHGRLQVKSADGKLRVYVITPFKRVSTEMLSLLENETDREDAKAMCGTVHTFQGKEADFVVFLLGGDPNKPGVISSFAGRKPNLVNVAVTRAKKRLYVIGDKNYWSSSADSKGYYKTMAQLLA